jgi:hypothetical protein
MFWKLGKKIIKDVGIPYAKEFRKFYAAEGIILEIYMRSCCLLCMEHKKNLY